MKCSLKRKIFIFLGGSALITLLFVSITNLLIINRTYTLSIHEQLELIGHNMEVTVQERLSALKNNLLAISEDGSLKKYAESYVESVLDYHLNKYRLVVPFIGYADKDGVTLKELANGQIVENSNDFKTDSLYAQVRAHPNEVRFSPIRYESALKDYAIRFALLKQGYFEEQAYGIIYGAIPLEKLLTLTNGLEQITFRIMDEKGILQYSSRNEKHGEKLLPERLAEGVHTVTISHDETFTWAHLFQGHSQLLVSYEYEEAMSGAYEMIAVELLILLVVFLFALYFTRRYVMRFVLSPIIELTKGTRIIMQGDYTHAMDIQTGDEIQDLADHFNHMVKKLDVLMQEIGQQQAELEASNRKLGELNVELEKRVAHKIKELRSKDQLLIQQSRLAAMGEMIGNIAHQWRQPLNALGLVLQNQKMLFERSRLDADKMETSTNKGMELIGQMSRTIDDFRDFFKPDKEAVRFDIADVLKQGVEFVKPNLEHEEIMVEWAHLEACEIEGYPREFSQVVLNLLSNAKDALAEKKERGQKWIRISAMQQEDRVRFIIEDNGGGIPKEVMPKIFDSYFTTKEEGKGTGIGLYMSKTIIEQHMGGTIAVQNTEEGAQFFIQLPKGDKSV